MADFTSSYENPIISAASSSSPSSGAVDDSYEDACSICLEPFNTQDPATVTNCKHEYHLQCILEWSQRSKECPICAQFLLLRDPASQELLAAVESERSSRTRRQCPSASTILHHFNEDSDVDLDASYSDDSDFDERIMQHLAAVASRARYVRRRERQRSSGLSPSQVLSFARSANVPDTQRIYTTSPEGYQNLGYELSDGDSPTSNALPTISVQPPFSVDPSVTNRVPSRWCQQRWSFQPQRAS
ncbi:hypothetical protein L1049_016102 [Liquidambar formosana]|uniref:RING-type E3 ubiquitin transferase n=1 Tax=Liquidambar formosana TaxID=63359 RepID=A0AAP0X706_LIQFO